MEELDRGDIVLIVASSRIASLLLPEGRTMHSRFARPLNATEDSTCNIKQGSPLASLIMKRKLIIWDEAPMMHRYCFEDLDKTLRDILGFEDISNLDWPFGGKKVVLGGYFRKILPVITKGNRQDIVNATLKSSYLWDDCHLLKQTKNIRLEGKVDGVVKDPIPDDVLISDCEDPISAIVNSTYPDYYSHCSDVSYLQKRAILAPTLDMVESINEHMVSLNQCEGTTFFSSDTMCLSKETFTGLDQINLPGFIMEQD
ncbi:uncharacterized protein LOC124887392 [Capsicum annuum]|uniref:uncharacterized protein LOC124887392 n=1 Tax=Capsicum annuum TaxID=4072 RepID=UPI001FB05BA0|nr:uncharacterized protein LOC124887392 [Capsicum annuum]